MHRRTGGAGWVLLAGLILIGAAVLRLYHLPTYPPGPHYDEGAYLLITRAIADGARFFPIVEAYQGREVLYMYLNAPLLSLLGDHILTLRISSAWLNLLTVAATIALGRLLFPGRRGWLVGLIAGLLIALSFPQFWLARQAFRAVTLPLLQAIALVLLWRGLRARRHWPVWLTLAGVCAGGALYTYMASRLFPVWLAIGGLVLLIGDARRWRHWLPRAGVFYTVLIVTALPMLVYAVQKPDIFFGRLTEVTQTPSAITLADSVIRHVRMFFLQGDPYFRYNIPDRPYLTAPEGLLMLVGLIVCGVRLIARHTPPLERPAYALALLSPLMVIPSVISVGGLPPSHMRSLGMIPLLFILCAIGGAWLWERLPSRWASDRAFMAGIAALVVIGVPLNWMLYRTWAASAPVYYETDADLNAAGHWLIAQADAGTLTETVVYVGARDRGHPTLDTLPVPSLTYLGTDSLFRPPPGQTGLYVFPRSAPPAPDFAAWLEPGRVTAELPIAPDGRTAFEVFRRTADDPLPALTPPPEPLRNLHLDYHGLTADPLIAGQSGRIVTYWTIMTPPVSTDFTPLFDLIDAAGNILYTGDAYVIGAERWQAGAVLFQSLTITPPVTTPPGAYRVRMRWVERAADRYAAFLNADGSPGGISAVIGTVTVAPPVTAPDPASVTPAVPLAVALAPGITLRGIDVQPTIRTGEALPIALYWSADSAPVPRPDQPYRLVLLPPDGTAAIVLYEGVPAGAEYPPSAWRTGDLLAERPRPRLPRTLTDGVYQLVLRSGGAHHMLAPLTVTGFQRQFQPVTLTQPASVTFADGIVLTGWEVTHDADADRLTLVWHTSTERLTDYTLFVHRLDAAGQIVDQVDAMPLANTYPTSLWVSGEYITERLSFPPDARVTAYRVGWYDAATGQRLPVLTADLPVDSAAVMLEAE